MPDPGLLWFEKKRELEELLEALVIITLFRRPGEALLCFSRTSLTCLLRANLAIMSMLICFLKLMFSYSKDYF